MSKKMKKAKRKEHKKISELPNTKKKLWRIMKIQLIVMIITLQIMLYDR